MRLISIDIETSGPIMGVHDLMAIGTAFCEWDSKHPGFMSVKRRRFVMPFSLTKYDPQTMRDFWSKNTHVLRVLEKERYATALDDFVSYLDDLDRQGPVQIISDNPTYDLGWINYYLALSGKLPIDFYLGTDGFPRHRKHIDVRSVLAGVRASKLQPRLINRLVNPCPHLPDWDAEHTLRIFCCTLSSLDARGMNIICTFNKLQ